MNPYISLDDKYFWAKAIAQKNMFDIAELWDPKYKIGKKAKVATYGSCFAQHIGRALHARGYNYFISEPAPQGLSEENARKFNYGIFTTRTGNIYSVSLLRQWLSWSIEGKPVPDEVWEKEGRFFDPFRPNIEPGGFLSADEVRKSRQVAIEAFKSSITDAEVFVFTLGLTESWFYKDHAYEYPMCPGTVAGEFDSTVHEFLNQDYAFIRKTLNESIRLMRASNPKLKILLTVSPVPLTATMSGNHVLIATMESKSILRAVAGSIQKQFPFVDYFPSYEIINSTPYRGGFFEPNQRQVNHSGVGQVMKIFFDCLNSKFPSNSPDRLNDRRDAVARSTKRMAVTSKGNTSGGNSDDVVCEEELLEAFGGRK